MRAFGYTGSHAKNTVSCDVIFMGSTSLLVSLIFYIYIKVCTLMLIFLYSYYMFIYLPIFSRMHMNVIIVINGYKGKTKIWIICSYSFQNLLEVFKHLHTEEGRASSSSSFSFSTSSSSVSKLHQYSGVLRGRRNRQSPTATCVISWRLLSWVPAI